MEFTDLDMVLSRVSRLGSADVCAKHAEEFFGLSKRGELPVSISMTELDTLYAPNTPGIDIVIADANYDVSEPVTCKSPWCTRTAEYHVALESEFYRKL